MWKAGVRKGARPLLPSNGAGTQLLPSNQVCFLPKMERCDQMGAFLFFWVINQLKSHWCCLAPKSAPALDASTCPVLDPRSLWASRVGGHSVQGTEKGPRPASSQHLGRASKELGGG